MKNLLLILFIILTCLSCKKQNKNNNDNEKKVLVARAHEKYLYSSDLNSIIPHKISASDSLMKVSNYIDFWIKNQLILKKAEMNLLPEEKDVEQQLEDYRAALLIYKYKQKFIEQKLDTFINQQDIQKHYDSHSNEFPLFEPMLKAQYLKFSTKTKEIWKIRNIFSNTIGNKAQDTLIKFCKENSIQMNNFNGRWIKLSDLHKGLPLKIQNESDFLKNIKYTECSDSLNFYLLEIREYKLKGEDSPLPLVYESIKNIIINKKKLGLINELEQNIYNEALHQGQIKVYNQKK